MNKGSIKQIITSTSQKLLMLITSRFSKSKHKSSGLILQKNQQVNNRLSETAPDTRTGSWTATSSDFSANNIADDLTGMTDNHGIRTFSTDRSTIKSKIGRYRLLYELGKGGMGVVYCAEDTILKRKTALKVLNIQELSEETLARFKIEAVLIARLNHPNIVTIYELNPELPDPYIAMELLHGNNLKTIIKQKPDMSIEDRLQIILDICNGLFHAHENDIIHRDIKPANIFIANDDSARLMDFGLAKYLNDDYSLTKTGAGIGTPAYMSPEQIRGEQLDYRTDIFSLGIVLYELLTGKRPFDAENVNAITYCILTNNPAKIDGSVPSDLQKIVKKTLQKNPEDRYQNVSELIEDLQSVVSDKPLKHAQYSSSMRLIRFFRKKSNRFLVLAVLIVSAIVITGKFFYDQRIPTDVIVQERNIVVNNQYGRVFWNWFFDYPLDTSQYKINYDQSLKLFPDLNKDGKNDLVFATHYSDYLLPNSILFFRHNGNLINNITAGRKITRSDGKMFEATYFISTLHEVRSSSRDINFLAIMRHNPDYIGLIWLLDRHGQVLSEYINEGHMEWVKSWDVDADGIDELVVGGTRNHQNFDCGVIVVLDPDSFTGISPGGFHYTSFEPELPDGKSALYYLRFPNLWEWEGFRAGTRGEARPFVLVKDELKIAIPIPDLEVELDFYFDHNFENMKCRFSESTYLRYRAMQMKSPSMLPLKEIEQQALKKVLFWNGSNWVNHPTRIVSEVNSYN